jgi:hypothetical protein
MKGGGGWMGEKFLFEFLGKLSEILKKMKNKILFNTEKHPHARRK